MVAGICKYRLFFILLCLCSYTANTLCQSQDSATHEKKQIRSVKPCTDFDQRFSYMNNMVINIWGQRVGLIVNNKFKVGIGFYFTNNTLKKDSLKNIPYWCEKQNITFGTGYFEPFFFRKKYWELSMPFEAGYGLATHRTYLVSNNRRIGTVYKNFIPFGTGLSLSVKFPYIPYLRPLNWVGINFLAGYRYCILKDNFKTNYNGLFWSVGGAIFLDRIYDYCLEHRKRHII